MIEVKIPVTLSKGETVEIATHSFLINNKKNLISVVTRLKGVIKDSQNNNKLKHIDEITTRIISKLDVINTFEYKSSFEKKTLRIADIVVTNEDCDILYPMILEFLNF